jgi:hypothetical protein
VNITIPDLTGVECGEIAITAAEGGIGYWAQIETYEPSCWDIIAFPDGVADDFVFYRIAAELSDMGPYDWEHAQDVTPAWIRQGFERCYAAPMDKGGWGVRNLIANVERVDWTGEIDSDVADLIYQFAFFGGVVYG